MRYLFPVLIAASAFAAPGSATLLLTAGSATITSTDVGSAFTINYDGRGGTSVTTIGGLTATSIFSLASVDLSGKTWTFNYSFDNTSTAPVNTSRLTAFGLNVNRALGDGSSATGVFGSGVGSGNVPNAQPNVDICFRAGGGGGGCAGGGNGGVTIADNAATGTFTLKLAAAQSSVALSNFYVRYQTLTVAGNSATSATGLGAVLIPAVVAVPEPATWAMMLVGFGIVGAGMRRRKLPLLAA